MSVPSSTIRSSNTQRKGGDHVAPAWWVAVFVISAVILVVKARMLSRVEGQPAAQSAVPLLYSDSAVSNATHGKGTTMGDMGNRICYYANRSFFGRDSESYCVAKIT